MKREQLYIKGKRAFSLVELLVSVSIFLVFVSAIMDTTVGVNRQMVHASNIERASILAGEAMEVSRNIRDNNFANLTDGTYGLSTSTGQWVLLGSSDNLDIFNRQLTISTINTNQKKVDVLVTWSDRILNSNSVSASTYLTNWKKITPPAGLTVTKTVINHGGTKVTSDFAPFKVGTTTISLASSTTFLPDTYTVSETADSTYTSNFAGDCDSLGVITLVPGDAKICSITNEEKPSKIIVNKTVINHGQNKTIGDFTLYVDAVPVISGDLNTFDSGSHTVSESANSDYTATIGGDCSSGGAVTLFPNQTKTCSITNEEKLAYLTVNKTVINHGGTKISADFAPYKVDTTTVTLGASTVFDSGTYTVTEATSSTHTTIFSGDCNSSGVVTLTSGSSKTCTITNEEIIVNVAPTVTTASPITSITRTTAVGGGNVTSDGGASVTSRGIVWSTSINPTIALPTKTSDGTGTGAFTSSIASLTCNTLYYVKAYATNSVGTSYGSEVTFTTSPCSTVTFVGASSAGGTTVTIPTHQVGDLLVIFTYRDGNASAPSLPIGWTNIGTSGGANSNASRLAYRVATVNNTLSGTWTGATGIVVHVYRGQNTSNPIGGNANTGSASTIVTYPTLTMTQVDGSSVVVGFAGHRSINTTLETPPTGMTNRTNFVNATNEVSGHDTNIGVGSWTNTNVNVGGTSSGWRARTLEILSQ